MAPKERRQVYPAFWRKSANGQNSPAYGRENRVQLGGRTQLPAAVTDVIPDRVIAESQSIRDLRGSPAQRDQPQHLQFPQGQRPGHSPVALPPRGSPTGWGRRFPAPYPARRRRLLPTPLRQRSRGTGAPEEGHLPAHPRPPWESEPAASVGPTRRACGAGLGSATVLPGDHE